MSNINQLHSKVSRIELHNTLTQRLSVMEATVLGAMHLLDEQRGKETPVAYALFVTFEELKESVQELRALEKQKHTA
jgi:hypothetical protein